MTNANENITSIVNSNISSEYQRFVGFGGQYFSVYFGTTEQKKIEVIVTTKNHNGINSFFGCIVPTRNEKISSHYIDIHNVNLGYVQDVKNLCDVVKDFARKAL